jgi:hypothetical protein
MLLAESIRAVPAVQVDTLRRRALEQVVLTPEDFMDMRLALAGTVDERLNDRALRLSTGIFGAELLVAANEAAMQGIEDGMSVTVYGVLHPFDAGAIQAILGATALEQLAEKYEDQPVLRAERIETSAP